MTVIRYCLGKHRQLLIDIFYYKARCQTLLFSRLRNNIRGVRTIIPTCKSLMQVGKKKNPVRHINHPLKAGSSLHWFALNYSLTTIATASAVRKREWKQRGWGWSRDPFCFLSHVDGQRDESGRKEMAVGLIAGVKGENICFTFRWEMVFSSLQGWSSGLFLLSLLFYIFLRAIWDRTLNFVKMGERGCGLGVLEACSSPSAPALGYFLCVFSPGLTIPINKEGLRNFCVVAVVQSLSHV